MKTTDSANLAASKPAPVAPASPIPAATVPSLDRAFLLSQLESLKKEERALTAQFKAVRAARDERIGQIKLAAAFIQKFFPDPAPAPEKPGAPAPAAS